MCLCADVSDEVHIMQTLKIALSSVTDIHPCWLAMFKTINERLVTFQLQDCTPKM